MHQDIGGQVITLRIRMPLWLRVTVCAALVWHRIGLPLDVDRFAAWAARRTKISAS